MKKRKEEEHKGRGRSRNLGTVLLLGFENSKCDS